MSDASAPWLGAPHFSLLILLFTGHVLGDFLFQTRAMVERKSELQMLLRHAALVLTAHFIFVLPFVSWAFPDLLPALALLLLLTVFHALVDLGKDHLKSRWGGESVSLFLGDQAIHGGAILCTWTLWLDWLGASPTAWVPDDLTSLTAVALLLSAYVLNGNGAAALIKLFLDQFPVSDKGAPDDSRRRVERMGRTIGILERMLLLSLILLGHWQAVGWIFAGKTVARFRELNDRDFSEYYLIGTLSSLLFAAATGSGVRWVLTGSL